ncbi:hypothetical protein TcasGA2_TC034525 [Tribolium castaneum]|uniref:Uncharacterized protein n=1 Tax=Tribolium castaneum TaxID=7070 RepID=A0A139WPI0_TRICA|nr:hypothetical protein TcasGA2_TC034525 [Tribolium castaneum]
MLTRKYGFFNKSTIRHGDKLAAGTRKSQCTEECIIIGYDNEICDVFKEGTSLDWKSCSLPRPLLSLSPAKAHKHKLCGVDGSCVANSAPLLFCSLESIVADVRVGAGGALSGSGGGSALVTWLVVSCIRASGSANCLMFCDQIDVCNA